jgi:hypothetical protein
MDRVIRKKIFHGYVGFALVGATFFLIYNSAVVLFSETHGTSLQVTGPPELPRLAFTLGLPACAAAVFWKQRRYAAVGALFFAFLAAVYWLASGQN